MNEERYKIIWPGWNTVRVIGSGSYGDVYEVERDFLGVTEKAAVKCLSLPRNAGEIEDLYGEGYDEASISSHYDDQLRQIVQEYKLMAELKSNPYVVRCEDIQYERQPNGLGWDVRIKMELLTPMNRAKLAGTPEQQAVRLGRDLCEALIECKNRNIVHRDIKPQNIFVSDRGDFKLGDFGIARTMEKTTGATKTGTYNYMAPEVYHEQPYGHQADVYSLGMVLYWLLNEKRGPFLPLPPQVPTAAQQEQARLRRFAGEPLPPPKNGSEALKAIVLKACAFDPKDRYTHAGELYNELQALRNGKREPAPGPVGADASGGPQEKERIATPVTRSLVRNDKDGPVGAIHESPAVNRTPSSHTVGADALGGPRSDGSAKQNPSGPAGHLPLQGRQEKADAPAAKAQEKDPSTPLRSAQDDKAAKQNPSGPAGHLPLQGRQEKANAQAGKATPAASPPVILSEAKNLPETKGKDPSTPAVPPLRMTNKTEAAVTLPPQSAARTAPPEGAPTPAPSEKKGKGALIAGIAAVLVLAVVALFLLPRLHGSVGNEEKEPPVDVETTTPTEEPAPASESDAGADEADGLSFSLDGESLTVSGEGEVTGEKLSAAIPDWETMKDDITAVQFSEGVTGIGASAFSGCRSLTEIYFTGSAPSIGDGAFEGVTATAYYPGLDPVWNEAVRQNYGGAITWSAVWPEYIVAHGDCGDDLIWALDDAGTLTISGSGEMWDYVSYNPAPWNDQRGSIREAVLKPGVTNIGSWAFNGCGSLTSISIPEGVIRIDGQAFHGCSSLTSVTIPKGVTNIGSWAFYGCRSLQDVYYAGTQEQWMSIVIDANGNDRLTNATIHYNSK